MVARLILGDALEELPRLESQSIDCVITDPPYGIAYKNGRADLNPHIPLDGVLLGDNDRSIGQRVIDQCFANGWPVCAFAHHLHPWAGKWRQHLVWDKGGGVGGGGDIATCWKFTWELIQVGGFGRLNGERDSAVLPFFAARNGMSDHPTQKPVKLMRYLIEKLTKRGDTILDPCAGSGTTLVAALLTGRNAIGIEIDPAYHAIAQRRIDEVDEVPALVKAAGLFDAQGD